MISALVPGFLAAGSILAIAPIVLHLLARRPPDREPLPTARFLREDARTLLRLQRRPTNLRLLAVRMLFALSLGAAFAGMTWTPGRAGTGLIVLLDAGADPGSDWGAARVTAQQTASATTDTPNGTGTGAPTGAIILVYGLDDGPRIVAPEDVGQLVQGSLPATAEDGLRALRSTVLSETSYDQAAVAWVMRPSWRTWSPSVGLLRPEVWPARIALRPVGGASETAPTHRLMASIPNQLEGGPLSRAVSALGIDSAEVGTVADWVFAAAPTAAALSELAGAEGSGQTNIYSGRLSAHVPGIPWAPGVSSGDPRVGEGRRSGEGPRDRIVLPTGVTLGAATDLGGTASPGAHIVAVFEDATPAATAVQSEAGCIVYLAASIDDPSLVSSPEYPALIDALGHACSGTESVDGPLDRGAIYALERPDLPLQVNLARLAASRGAPLGRWVALLAILLLVAEVGMTRGRKT
jgi:hypothetical protein